MSDLVGNPEDRFSHDAVRMRLPRDRRTGFDKMQMFSLIRHEVYKNVIYCRIFHMIKVCHVYNTVKDKFQTFLDDRWSR